MFILLRYEKGVQPLGKNHVELDVLLTSHRDNTPKIVKCILMTEH